MPRAKESLRIEVTASTAGEMRNIQIALNVPAQEFLLSDLLSQRGALTSIEVMLKQAVKSATEEYLTRTEELIAGIVDGQKVNTSSSKPGLKSIGKGANSAATKRAIVPNDNSAKTQQGEPGGSTSADVARND
jgi:hypothetical protein